MFRPMPQAEARARLGLPADRRLVLFAAPPTNPRKRHCLACAAVDRLDPALCAELVVATRVSHASMPLYMSACDAVILTSTHEGSPNVVKEALACDLPVAAVDVGDVRLRIGDVEGCVVFADDRPETLAAGLDRVLRRGGRVAGRERVTELDERLLAVRTISVYRKALRRA
jgi:teichuronic acid biosynthesis glycosyltransferase TuaC